jgi:putative ABC transport system substrate-binding protein
MEVGMGRVMSVLTALVLMVCPVTVSGAQQPAKISRIGYLTNRLPALGSVRREEMLRALRGFGYIEGQNISTEYRSAEGKLDRIAGLAAELVSLKVDVIIVDGGFTPIQAAANATKTIPIVMAGPGLDPVEAGFVKSLAQPGGNITGFTALGGYLGGKRLEILKDAIPKVARVAILYEANNPHNMFEFKEVIPARRAH